MHVLAGLLCDLLWADPEDYCTGWLNGDRGNSFGFGEDIIAQFCEKYDVDIICRAHTVVEDGYKFYAQRQLVSLFSAPHYCGEFDNSGGIMHVDENLQCSFKVLAPA